jgi:hypothetical protein
MYPLLETMDCSYNSISVIDGFYFPKLQSLYCYHGKVNTILNFDKLEEWFPKDKYRWESKEFAKAAGAKKGGKQSMGEELLIMNY